MVVGEVFPDDSQAELAGAEGDVGLVPFVQYLDSLTTRRAVAEILHLSTLTYSGAT